MSVMLCGQFGSCAHLVLTSANDAENDSMLNPMVHAGVDEMLCDFDTI